MAMKGAKSLIQAVCTILLLLETTRGFSALPRAQNWRRFPMAISTGSDAKKTTLIATTMSREPNEIDQLLPQENENEKQSVGNKILSLAIPAAGALLLDPLMSLADVAFVGRFSRGPDALAGMGSAASLLTFSFYLCNFLCTATTPLVASKRAANQEEQARAVGGQALTLAATLGGLLIAILLIFGQPLLRVMGTENTGVIASNYALTFLSIRALAAPAVLVLEASTGILRGYLDTKTPIMVLIGANMLNLLLDVILIVYAGLGPMGAAIATTSAEWISASIFLAVLSGKLPSAGEEKKLQITPLLSVPSFEDVKPLLVASGSVLLRTLVLQLSLSTAAAMAARGGSVAAASIAAHQVGIQLWLLCSFFCDSLAAASQGLVADALGRDDAKDVLEVANTVFLYSLILGLFLAALLQVGLSSGLLFELFSKDTDVRACLSEILPFIIIAQPLNALVFSADGVLQGASQFPYQAKAMLISGLTAVSTFAAMEYFQVGSERLVHVWSALIALQVMRGLTSLWKLIDEEGPINLLRK